MKRTGSELGMKGKPRRKGREQSGRIDQQTVPGSEQVQEDLLISPQSSSIGIMSSVFFMML